MAKAKTINLLLEDGTPNGMITISSPQWNLGEMYCAPRNRVDTLLAADVLKSNGIYFLLSKEVVYIGQSSDILSEINIADIDWWEKLILLTTDDNSFNRTDLDYLEMAFVEKAEKNNRLESDVPIHNHQRKITKFREAELQQYLEDALSLMQLMGIDVFNNDNKRLITSVLDNHEDITIYSKREAKLFLEENNIHLNPKFTFAKKQPDDDYFWANPRTYFLEESWNIVLHNQDTKELYILLVPAGKLKLSGSDGPGLEVRGDKPFYIDLRINSKTFKDMASGIDFKPFIINKIQY